MSKSEPNLSKTEPISNHHVYRQYVAIHVFSLKQWREKNQVSNRKLSKMLDVSSATLRHWFNGKRQPISERSWAKIETFQDQNIPYRPLRIGEERTAN